MFSKQLRRIVLHALPMLIAQIASMGMPFIDTILLGHHNTEDLAAVAIGGGLFITVNISLCGILQAVAPIVAHLKGAGRDDEIGGALHQCFWLALMLSVPFFLILYFPSPILNLFNIEPAVNAKVHAYLRLLAFATPAILAYRSFYAFSNALRQPKPLMMIAFLGTITHGFLASFLVSGSETQASLGVIGCGLSNVIVNWLTFSMAALYLAKSRALSSYRLMSNWKAPSLARLSEQLRLGLPMGFSSFVEISSFAFITLFIAKLGAPVLAGHRVVANLGALCYMLPLALSIATLAEVGQAAGAQDWSRARTSVYAGLSAAALLSTLLGCILWVYQTQILNIYTNDAAVQTLAKTLFLYIAIYQVFDALQTVAAFALRAYKVTLGPMFVHIICFWGVGLYGGWLLAFKTEPPMGVVGYWLAMVISLVFAALAFGFILHAVMREKERQALIAAENAEHA